jgi:hypothetical protein
MSNLTIIDTLSQHGVKFFKETESFWGGAGGIGSATETCRRLFVEEAALEMNRHYFKGSEEDFVKMVLKSVNGEDVRYQLGHSVHGALVFCKEDISHGTKKRSFWTGGD